MTWKGPCNTELENGRRVQKQRANKKKAFVVIVSEMSDISSMENIKGRGVIIYSVEVWAAIIELIRSMILPLHAPYNMKSICLRICGIHMLSYIPSCLK